MIRNLTALLFLASPMVVAPMGAEQSRKPPTSEVFLPFDAPAALAGRTYYLLEEGASCLATDTARTRIRTWRQRIEFTNDRVLIWGELCNDAAELLPLVEARVALRVTSDREAVLYRDRRLAYAASPPKLCEAGLWCPVPEAGQ